VIYLVTYDFEDGADDAALIEALGRYDAVPVRDGVWLVEADTTAKDVRAALQRAVAKRRCRLFVGRLQGEGAYLNLPGEAADWLDDRDEYDFD
jgi:hypothetical protein